MLLVLHNHTGPDFEVGVAPLAPTEADVVLAAADLLVHGLLAVQRVAALVHVGELHRRSHLQRAAIRLLLARDHPEQRRLARTVRPDDADDRARRHLERQIVDQQTITVALAHVTEVDDVVAESFGDGDEDFLRLVALLMLV